MSQKILAADGETEIEVFTADEVQAKADEAAAAAEAKLKPDLEKATGEVTRLDGLLKSRAKEFAGFRELNEEQVAKLDEKDRIIYENQKAIKASEDARIADTQAAQKAQIAAAIEAKAGGNTKLAEKMTSMWDIITVDAKTPQEIEAKLLMVLGAISTTAPDLLATVAGFSGGSYVPPKTTGGDGKSFADTPEGQAFAKSIGLDLEGKKA